MIMEFITTILLSVFVITQSADLPSTFTICKENDPNLAECFGNAAVQAIRAMAPGIPSLKLLPIDPLAVNRITIAEGKPGIVNVKQDYQNCQLYGLSKGLTMDNYNVDLPNLIFSSVSFNPQVDFVADYTLDGNVLVLPIKGDGRSNITMLNLKTQHTFYGEKFVKDGDTYMRVKKYDVKFTPEKVLMNFDNLFAGDTTLGAKTNAFLNQNANILFKELQQPYEQTFGVVFAKMANDVFTQVPFNKILPAT